MVYGKKFVFSFGQQHEWKKDVAEWVSLSEFEFAVNISKLSVIIHLFNIMDIITVFGFC